MKNKIFAGLYITIGVILTLMIMGIYATYQRRDALKVAWEYPQVVSTLKIDTSLKVASK